MMKTYLKNEKGITITVLIITIVIMLILAGVGISAIAPGGLTERVEGISEDIPIQQAIEEVHNNFDYKYYLMTNGKIELKDAIENKSGKSIVGEIARISIETEVPVEKFTINYKYTTRKGDINEIYYRGDLVTDEEKNKLEANNITLLKGDLNIDGIITNEDLQIMNDIVGGTIGYKYFGDDLDTVNKIMGTELIGLDGYSQWADVSNLYLISNMLTGRENIN